jgi:hypothetical protein
VREAATKSLIAMGPDVLDMVKKAAEETQNAEAKMRCQAIVKELTGQRELGRVESSKVTLSVKDAPLSDVLKELARQSGNRELLMDKGLGERKVTANLKDAPYWQAVETVCASAEVCFAGKASESGIMETTLMARPAQTVELVAQAGSAMVMVGGVKRNSSNYLDLHIGKGKPDAGTIAFDMQVYLEDRLPLTRVALKLTDVTTADGVKHARPQPGEPSKVTGRVPAGTVATFWNTSETWDNTADWLTGPVTLDGTLQLAYGTEPKELRIDKVLDSKNVEVAADGKKLKLRQLMFYEHGPAMAFVTLEDPADESIEMTDGRGTSWGLFLVDPDGKRHPGTGMMLTFRGTTSEKTVAFPSVSMRNGNWSLIYVYPGKVVEASYPFTIQAVPLQ